MKRKNGIQNTRQFCPTFWVALQKRGAFLRKNIVKLLENIKII